MINRPLDILHEAKGKKIILKLKNGDSISGTLRAVDLYMNMWIDGAEIQKNEGKTKIGTILVRGDGVVYASPV